MSEEIRNTEAMENEFDVEEEVTEVREEGKFGKVVSTIGNGVKKHGKKVAIGAAVVGAFVLGKIVGENNFEDDEFDYDENDSDDTIDVTVDVETDDTASEE